MKRVLLVCKVITALFWIAAITSLCSVFPELVTTILGWAGAIVLLIHFVEVILFARHFAGRLEEPKLNKLMVLVFGLFYVLPLLRKAQPSG